MCPKVKDEPQRPSPHLLSAVEGWGTMLSESSWSARRKTLPCRASEAQESLRHGSSSLRIPKGGLCLCVCARASQSVPTRSPLPTRSPHPWSITAL